MQNYYHSYKGIFYKFIPKGKSNIDVWQLSDDETDMVGNLATYNADVFRIDQCLAEFTSHKQPWMPYKDYVSLEKLKNHYSPYSPDINKFKPKL